MIRRPDNEPRLFTARWWGWAARWVFEEWRLGWGTSTVWPARSVARAERRYTNDIRDPADQRLAIAATLIFIVAVAFMGLEACSQSVRDWTSDRPVIVGILTAVAVLTPATFIVERSIAVREALRWRRTAISGIQTYIWQADGFNARFLRLLIAADEQVRRADEVQSLEAMTERLALRRPGVFERVSQLVRSEADANGHLALAAASTMALHPPMASYVNRLWDIQDQLRAIDEECIAIAFIRGPGDRPPPDKAVPIVTAAARKIADLSFARQRALMELKLDVDDLAGAGPSAASKAQDDFTAATGTTGSSTTDPGAADGDGANSADGV